MAKKGLKIEEWKNGIGSTFKDARGNKITKTQLVKSSFLRDSYGVHVVAPKNGTKYIRSNPDNKTGNNLE